MRYFICIAIVACYVLVAHCRRPPRLRKLIQANRPPPLRTWNKPRDPSRYENFIENDMLRNMNASVCARLSDRFVLGAESPFGFCELKDGDGSHDMLVVGDGLAINLGPVVYDAFKRHARHFDILSLKGCDMMTKHQKGKCKIAVNYMTMLNELKPEVIFVLQSHIVSKRVMPDAAKNIDEDDVFREQLARLTNMEKFAKKVYILQALPTLNRNNYDLIYTHNSIRELKERLVKNDEISTRKRIEELKKRCSKCEIIDIKPALVDSENRYLGYDPLTNLLFIDQWNNFTRSGRDRVRKEVESPAPVPCVVNLYGSVRPVTEQKGKRWFGIWLVYWTGFHAQNRQLVNDLPRNLDISKCIRLSNRFAPESSSPFGFCEMKEAQGTHDMLVLGDSYAINLGPVVYDAFVEHAKKFNILSMKGCDVMVRHQEASCNVTVNYTDVLNTLKPEVIFVFQRHIGSKKPIVSNIGNDSIFLEQLASLKEFEKVAKKVYILQAVPSKRRNRQRRYRLKKTVPRPSDRKDRLIVSDDTFARKRIEKLGEQCTKCEIIDIKPVLVKSQSDSEGYDKLLYVTEWNNFNRIGRERASEVLKELAEKFVL
nr:Protein OAC-10 [Haemonchus contortus]